MELVIKISKETKQALAVFGIKRLREDLLAELGSAIAHGIELPEHHGELADKTALMKQWGLDKATKYGNEDAEQQHFSYSHMMMYEIADMIDGAETIIPASEGEIEPKNFWCTKKSQWCDHQSCNNIPIGFPRECDPWFKKEGTDS